MVIPTRGRSAPAAKARNQRRNLERFGDKVEPVPAKLAGVNAGYAA
jgi:hypothetical protein